MNPPSAAKLYTPELLALAVQLANYPYDPALPLKGEARSRTCGSHLEIGLSVDDRGQIVKTGMRVTACAVGQAAAAIFAAGAAGHTGEAVALVLSELESWLGGSGNLPDWPSLAALTPARDHRGRHGAILLPWKASVAALCKAGQAG
jgi:NifU-like protein involved in Fe-S cluster formation